MQVADSPWRNSFQMNSFVVTLAGFGLARPLDIVILGKKEHLPCGTCDTRLSLSNRADNKTSVFHSPPSVSNSRLRTVNKL